MQRVTYVCARRRAGLGTEEGRVQVRPHGTWLTRWLRVGDAELLVAQLNVLAQQREQEEAQRRD